MAAVAGIEGRFAHQSVHTGFRPAPAVSILGPDVHGGALDARDLAGGNLHQLGIPAAALAPAQVHAQQHFSPVLSLGATGASLDFQVAGARVHLAGEHPLEFQLLDLALHFAQVATERLDDFLIGFVDCQIEHFPGVTQTALQRIEGGDHRLQARTLAAQFLGLFRVIPDGRVFQFPAYFFQPVTLVIEVKDTP